MAVDELMAFLDELSAAERKTFDEMLAALKVPVRARALDWYQAFGQGVLYLRGAQAVALRYGWIKRLARALGYSTSLLNKTRDFARKYSLGEAKSLAKKKITWGMVVPTLPVEGKEEQMAWMLRARDEQWNVHELAMKIQQSSQGPQRKGGRRRRKLIAYGPAVDLLSLVRLSEEWLRHHQEVWTAESTGLLDHLLALSPDEYSDTLLHQLAAAERALEDLARAASALREQLQVLRKKVKRALAARK
jgi:hypothetical protein